jgi:hypothetical protein
MPLENALGGASEEVRADLAEDGPVLVEYRLHGVAGGARAVAVDLEDARLPCSGDHFGPVHGHAFGGARGGLDREAAAPPIELEVKRDDAFLRLPSEVRHRPLEARLPEHQDDPLLDLPVHLLAQGSIPMQPKFKCRIGSWKRRWKNLGLGPDQNHMK